MAYRGKRAVDLAIAVPALVISLPLQAVVAVTVRATMGSPVLFRQERPGLHGELFTMRKFRTMRVPDPRQASESDELRLTAFGAMLRSTSMDELPTLWNIVRGDMSVVGPRPLLPAYLKRYSAEQARRHDVRPGLTGLAQIAGRNLVPWDERLALDVVYVDRASLSLDLRVILRTVGLVLRRRGISGKDSVTMTEFAGGGRS